MNERFSSRLGLNLNLSRAGGIAAFVAASASLALAQQPVQPRMGAPVAGLTQPQLDRFNAGKAVFDHTLSAAEGLGPIFNDTSCTHCHLQPAPGGASTVFVTRFGKAAVGPNPFDPLDALGGSLLQKQSINTPTCDEIVPPAADVEIHRITPPTFGFGLAEAISDADIQVLEAFPPALGITGEAHIVHSFEDPPGVTRVGRFGWKAQVATLLTFSADASLNEMGLTSRFLTQENAPNGNLVLLGACDSVPDPEDHADPQGFDQIDRMTDYQKFLAPPPQTPKSGMSGEAIFTAVRCSDCHVQTTYMTLPTAENGLANKPLKPYTDFLLHDVGTLGDGIVQGMANEQEFRTSPLWGVGHRATLALLHDGRANGGGPEANIDSAILSHDGEAAASRGLYVALSPTDKTKLQKFLISLGQAEFDIEYNNTVDEIDWFFLRPLMTGPGTFFTPDDQPAIADFDQDNDFDLRDIAGMQRAFTGP